MKYLLVISILIVVSCSNQPNDFEKYVKQLESLPTPLVVKTIEYPERKVLKNYDTALFEKFKLSDAQSVYGKIYEDDSITGIIYTVAGDVGVPVLVTYNKPGKKIDSLNLFQNASGFGLESEVYERLTLLPNRTIQVIDSLVTWDLNKNGDDRIEGSERVSIDSFYYLVDRNGKFNKHAE